MAVGVEQALSRLLEDNRVANNNALFALFQKETNLLLKAAGKTPEHSKYQRL